MELLKRVFGTSDRAFYNQLFRLLVPLIVQQALASALYLIDNLMVGQLGETSIAAVNAANQLSFLLQIITFGVTSGASILVAQFYGKGDRENIKRTSGLALLTAMIVGCIFASVGLFAPRAFMLAFSKEEAVIALGVSYIRISALGYICRALSLTFASVLKSCERVQLPMYSTVISVCVNAFFNYMLIFGKFGAPALGTSGAAIATLIASVLDMLIVFGVSIAQKSIALGKGMFRFHRSLVRQYFKTGAPVVINETLWSTGMTMFTVFFGQLGTYALAAAQIYNTYEKLGIILMVSVGNAASIMLGNKLGEGNVAQVKAYTTRLIAISGVCGLITGVLLLIAMPGFVSIFNVSDTARSEAIKVLLVYCCLLWIQMSEHCMIIGALRAGGDTIYSGICDVCCMWLYALPLLFFTGLVLKWPMWLSFLCASTQSILKLFLFGRRVYSWKWVKNLTLEVSNG